MKKKTTLLMFLLLLALTGCGGGGGGGGGGGAQSQTPGVPYFPTVPTVSIFGPNIDSPKYLVFSGANLYVTYQSGVMVIDGAGLQTNSYAVTNAVGIAVQSGRIYHSGEVGGQDTVMELGNGSGLLAFASNNFDGMVFYSTNMLFMANTNKVLAYTNFSNPQTIATLGATPLTMAADINRSRVYVTLGSNRIAEINPTNLSGMTSLTQTSPNQWGPLQRPNGLFVANDGFVYVANQGDLSGHSGYISKINAANGSTEVFFSETVGDWGVLPVGFCNPTGVTIDSGQQYLFVTNSDCSQSYSGYGNRNRILKIRLP
jgi:hypothetical protein